MTPPVALMAHYMPWFEAKPFGKNWGWHWTMNHFDPDKMVKNRREAACHDYPLIGLYDSHDPDALQCQTLLMKMAGINGVIFDWYGSDEFLDYGSVNRSMQLMVPFLQQAGLKFALCCEMQTIPKLIAAGKIAPKEAVAHGQRLMQWAQTNLFSSPAYLKLRERPVLLAFGDPFYKDAEWNQILASARPRPLFFTESNRYTLTTATVGAFDWPQPGSGNANALAEQDAFYKRAKAWSFFIPAAYPRFNDIYKEAGVGNSYGHIDDRDGRTYETTLTRALQSAAPIVQIATWNDWGEGTQIEPSMQWGYRDLETTQRLRRKYVQPSFRYTAPDLRLPIAWYLLRQKYAKNAVVYAKLAPFFSLTVAGQMEPARSLIKQYQS